MMKKTLVATFVIALSSTVVTSHAAVIQFDNNFYEFVDTTETWANARAASILMMHNGIAGDLVTIQSENENTFVSGLLNAPSWIGATDDDDNGVWKWVNGDIFLNCTTPNDSSSCTAVNGRYNSFNTGEPNDSGAGEMFAMTDGGGLWNDVNTAPQMGYVVEYVTPTSVPAPSILALLGLGCVGLHFARRRKTQL
jgi:hypothetical protein